MRQKQCTRQQVATMRSAGALAAVGSALAAVGVQDLKEKLLKGLQARTRTFKVGW